MKVFVRVFTLLVVAALLSCQNPANAPLKPSAQPPASSWVVSTLAGSNQGYVDATGASARFHHPYDVAVSAVSGTSIYVADYGNHRIRKITAAGVVSTIAGDGTAGFRDGARARFNHPSGVTANSSGVYVADTDNHRIRKIVYVYNRIDRTSNPVVSTIAGDGRAGYSNGYRYEQRHVPSSYWWYYHSTYYYLRNGIPVRFSSPTGIAINPAYTTNTRIYVADSGNNLIRKLTKSESDNTVTYPVSTIGVDVDDVDVTLHNPKGVAFDRLGNLYVADSDKHRILKFKTSGEISVFAGSARGTAGFRDAAGTQARFHTPFGVATDSSDNVYVADYFNNRIRMITPGGVVSTIAGGRRSYVDGRGDRARFSGPLGVAVDSSGNVYVADTYNHRIRKITRR